ncbi:Mov34/MPN/PAD-1 family protein [Candidatus Bathyarchaeota archaeon]|nr:Mov34/MPN/PAD-1 family protein [Candidatus Bathyarchaeota archaeon]
MKDDSVKEPLIIRKVEDPSGRLTLFCTRMGPKGKLESGIPFAGLYIETQPQTHGTIHRRPAYLSQLHNLLSNAGTDLTGIIRDRLGAWPFDNHLNLLHTRLLLIIGLPKTRNENGVIEEVEYWAFCSAFDIGKIGEDIGIWQVHQGTAGKLLKPDLTKTGENIAIIHLNPTPAFSREQAIRCNGLAADDEKDVVAVGIGALGSQVIMNLFRMGFRKWHFVDNDLMLPHNLARHALTDYVGYSKAFGMKLEAQNIFGEECDVEPIVANILEPGEMSNKIESVLKNANVILDMAVCVPVSRMLARDVISDARRCSLFLSPTAKDCVLLIEDLDRHIKLDYLEMVYYRNIATDPAFADHFADEVGRIRYGGSCRDITVTIRQDLVALHAAVGAGTIRDVLSSKSPRLWLWRADREIRSVTHYEFEVTDVIELSDNGWTVCYDRWLSEKIRRLRSVKLPNETGGVLIGSYDMQRKIIYVVDTILAPPDSVEYPYAFIRGNAGLRQELQGISKRSGGNLKYVGEWHSHPGACSPSSDDSKVFAWIEEGLAPHGYPPLMIIMGDQAEAAIFVNNMA